MKKRKIKVLVLLFTLLPVCGWAQKFVYLDASKPIEARIKDALSRMTLEEKAALCHAQSKFSSKGVPRLGIPVQLYVNDEKSSLPRPIKELKGFKKISLEPGKEKTVSFTLTKEDLSYYETKKILGLQNLANSKL